MKEKLLKRLEEHKKDIDKKHKETGHNYITKISYEELKFIINYLKFTK